MRFTSAFTFSFLLIAALSSCKSGMVTMSNKCYKLVEKGKQENKNGKYENGLTIFNNVINNCKSYDAREAGYAGKAAALNGLKRYDEALTIANEGFKYKNNSIDLLFEKASAELGLGLAADAKADLMTITSLTGRNQHLPERARIYAKMSEIDIRQQNFGNAITNAKQAINLDPSNPMHHLLCGDAYRGQENFEDAIAQYDAAIEKGKDDAEAWQAKISTRIKAAQFKYKTVKTETLAAKMSSAEKETLIQEIKTAQSKGVKDVAMELLLISLGE